MFASPIFQTVHQLMAGAWGIVGWVSFRDYKVCLLKLEKYSSFYFSLMYYCRC